MIASATLVLLTGCANGGGTGAVDAGHERPPRPDAAPAGDAGSVGTPDAASALDASSIDGGRPRPDGDAETDATVGADAGAMGDGGWRCCASDADCSASEVCVVTEAGGVCERAPRDRDCWTDADCESGETCGGARISECGDIRALFDTPGRCR